MNISLLDKTALVGGSTQGIGFATAYEMARLGARVICLARNEDKLKDVCARLPSNGGVKHDYIVADFAHPDVVRESVAGGLERIGQVHILVNNTGGPPGGLAKDASIEDYHNAFNMHLICNQILVQLCVPGMIEFGYGRIVNVISTSVKQPLPNLGVSNTVRGAVANWSKTLSNELGEYGITVNNVLPGATHTGRLESIASSKAKSKGSSVEAELQAMAQQVPLKRVAKAEEIAAGICFLASPAASYINGINLPIDGGRTGCL